MNSNRLFSTFLKKTLTLIRFLSLFPLIILMAADPHSTRHRYYAHWYFLSCSLIKPRPAQALLPGSGKSFPHPFPSPSLPAVPPLTNFPRLVLIMTLWTVSGRETGSFIPVRHSSLPAGMGKNLKKLSAVTESSLNRRIQLQQPQGISWMTSWMGNPFPVTHRRHCRRSFLSLPSSLPCRPDSLMPQASPFPVTARP